MDDNGVTMPWNIFQGTWRHFEDRAFIQDNLRRAIDRCDPRAFGRHLHSYQDSYSHAGYSVWTAGHFPASVGIAVHNALSDDHIDDPDDFTPDTDENDRAMMWGTIEWLRAFKKRCECSAKE
jgi:hypothetical protein